MFKITIALYWKCIILKAQDKIFCNEYPKSTLAVGVDILGKLITSFHLIFISFLWRIIFILFAVGCLVDMDTHCSLILPLNLIGIDCIHLCLL